MIWRSWQVKTLRGSSSLSQPWLCRLLLGTLPRGTEATAAQHPAAHQGWASAAVWVPEFGLQWSEKIVKVTFEKQQHHQRLRAHIPLPQLRWSVKLIMNLKPYLFTLQWWYPSVQNPLESMQTLSAFSALCFLLQPHYLLWLMITLCTISWASKERRWASEIRPGRY